MILFFIIMNAKKYELLFCPSPLLFLLHIFEVFFIPLHLLFFVDKVCAGTTIIFVADEKERVFYGHVDDLYNVFL